MKRYLPLALVALFVIPHNALAASNSHSNAKAEMQAMMEADQKMATDMNVKMTGDADKDFALMMIPHHQGAIDMAQVELKYGKDKELRALAKKIVDGQTKEIDQMKTWLNAQPGSLK